MKLLKYLNLGANDIQEKEDETTKALTQDIMKEAVSTHRPGN
jgi:hypothetical protein